MSIPADKMKARRDHVTPLCRQALEALRELHRMTGRGRYLFPGIGAKQPVISENTINLTLNKVGYKGRLVGHGSRHTASTLHGNTVGKKTSWKLSWRTRSKAWPASTTKPPTWNSAAPCSSGTPDYLDALETGIPRHSGPTLTPW